MKRPRTRALLPQSVARLVGLAALAAVGALEWQRLVGGLGSGRALLWVAGRRGGRGRGAGRRARAGRLPAARARAAGGGVRRRCSPATGSRAPASICSSRRHWDELLSGLGGGLQALGTVRLPYVSTDPWPRIVLELLGAELLILAGLLTFWPRAATPAPQPRVPLAAARPRLPVRRARRAAGRHRLAGRLARRRRARCCSGSTLAALTVCFLWLERLPLQARARRRGAAGGGARGRAAAGGGGRPRRAVVRLPLVRGEPRPRRSDPLLVDAELRADHLAARRQRGDAGRLQASRCTGRRATSTSSTTWRVDHALAAAGATSATSRSRPTSRRTGRTRPRGRARSRSASAGCGSPT